MSNCSLNLIMNSTKKISRNKEEKINQIYDTFFQLILQQGYHKTSTNHVAKSANISIGTIYNYFPGGKDDIIKKYFEQSMEHFFDSQDLIKMTDTNVKDYLNHFVSDLFANHKVNQGFNLAFRSAIQSDKELHEEYKKTLYSVFKEIVQKLRSTNELFKQFPEEKLLDVFIFMYNLVNAIIYHHLSVMELTDTDDKFIEYLTNLVAFSLKHYLQP